MSDFQAEKQIILDCYKAIDHDPSALKDFVTPEYHWRGYHPFYEQMGADAVVNQFWAPLHKSLSRIQRRMDIFIAGENAIDNNSIWVTSMGHLMGLFDTPWLNIPATGKMVMLRYCEFNRVENGKIAETAMYIDIPHLMIQTGLKPFPKASAQHMVQPGPMPHDALLFGPTDPAKGTKTLAAINQMVTAISNWDNPLPLEEELAQSWHDDMIWWGPAGIGATYTIERYAKQHSAPFRATFDNRIFNGHVAKIAEGNYGGFFGWPNLTLTPNQPFSGIDTKPIPTDMHVIDMYRRDGDKLAENWIFIDMPHFWMQQGVDIINDAIAGKYEN